MSLSTQAKLLRVLEDRKVERLGGSQAIPVDVRVVSATNVNLEKAVEEGRFRADLYYRLRVVQVALPPLRDRLSDVPELALHFLRGFSEKYGLACRSITPSAMAALASYAWPGNVRELESTLQRAVVMCASTTIHAQDIECAGETSKASQLTGSLRAVKNSVTMDAEKAYLVKTLVTFRGNVTHAAKAAGKERRSFQRLLRKYGIDRQSFQQAEAGPIGTYPPPLHRPVDGHA